jgi:hypothetical protein
MTTQPTRVRVMRLTVLLTAVFVVMALVVLVRDTPIAFTVFMFVGQPLFLVALALLLGAVLADLRAKQLL